MATGGRKTSLQVQHEISRTITFADGLGPLAAGVVVGVLPAGAVATITRVLTTTAWNGTVSVAASVGITATGTTFINGTDVRTAAARVDTVVPIASAGPFAVDTPIYASVAFGGTIGTAGSTTIIVEYAPAVG
jgi:hypothetical protein